jgi:hypothetical protein
MSLAQSFIVLLINEPLHHVSDDTVSQTETAGGWFAGALG